MAALPVLKPRQCPYCSHEWYPRTKKPGRICPACKRDLPVTRKSRGGAA